MKHILFGLFVLILTGFSSARAVLPDEVMSNPALEARAEHVSRELRCMVCQNESIEDSSAELARDLRLLVRRRIAAGDTDAQVINFLVSRYGEFILLKPRFELKTLLLWLLPPLVLLGGGAALWANARRRCARQGGEAIVPLTPDEEARLGALLSDEVPKPS